MCVFGYNPREVNCGMLSHQCYDVVELDFLLTSFKLRHCAWKCEVNCAAV